jgi:hypothetical protein
VYSITATAAVNVGTDKTSSVSFKKTAPIYYTGATNTARGLYHDLYSSTLTVTNNGSAAIAGGLEILLSGLAAQSPTVTLEYVTVNVGGTLYNLAIDYDSAADPFVVVPKSVLASLGKGSSLAVSLWFGKPSSSFVTYTPQLFSDPFDN